MCNKIPVPRPAKKTGIGFYLQYVLRIGSQFTTSIRRFWTWWLPASMWCNVYKLDIHVPRQKKSRKKKNKNLVFTLITAADIAKNGCIRSVVFYLAGIAKKKKKHFWLQPLACGLITMRGWNSIFILLFAANAFR